jgi:hypothetical protein
VIFWVVGSIKGKSNVDPNHMSTFLIGGLEFDEPAIALIYGALPILRTAPMH